MPKKSKAAMERRSAPPWTIILSIMLGIILGVVFGIVFFITGLFLLIGVAFSY